MPSILGANTLSSGGYDVANSAMFDRASTTKMAKTFGTVSTAAQRRKLTLSMWVKPSNVSDNQWLFCHDTGNASSDFTFKFESQALRFYDYPGADQMKKKTSRLFRDVSAWYHVMLIIDTTLGTAADRVQIYVNGVRETSFSESTDPDQNDSFFAFSDADRPTTIGARGSNNSDYLSGYLAEYHCIVGTAKAHTDFGEFDEDSGIWKPIEYTGGDYSSNGFYLDFADSGDLGDDESGNENDFTETNFAATHQSTDTCTNNFCTLNSVDKGFGTTVYTEGNLNATSSSGWNPARGTIAVTKGKWYWEIVSGNSFQIGVCSDTIDFANNDNSQDLTGVTVFYNASGGIIRTDGSQVGSTTATVDANDTMGFALDMDNKKLSVYKNGSIIVTNTSLSTSITDVAMIFGTTNGGGDFKINFGSPPYSESGGNSDGNGYGNFAASVPSNYYCLNTKNLAEYG